MPDPVYVDTWTIIQGETITRHYAFKNANGTPFDLTGYTLSCHIRKTTKSGVIVEPTLPLTGPATSGEIDLVMTDPQSSSVTIDAVVFDIKGVHPTAGSRRLVQGTLPVSLAVTHD